MQEKSSKGAAAGEKNSPDLVNGSFGCPNGSGGESFDSDAFCQIPWLVDITAAEYRDMVREKLQRNYHQDRQQSIADIRYPDHMGRDF